MWKGALVIGRQSVPISLYAAIEDRSIRFHMLHKKDHAPVEQHIGAVAYTRQPLTTYPDATSETTTYAAMSSSGSPTRSSWT